MWEPARLGAKQERITRLVSWNVVARLAARAQGENPWLTQRCQAFIQRRMRLHCREFPVVQAGSPELALLQIEAERLDQVQCNTGVRTQANNVAGIWGYFGFVENKAKHRAQHIARVAGSDKWA